MLKKILLLLTSISIILSMSPFNPAFAALEINSVSDNWDGKALEEYADGTGTKSDPYRITNAGELARMVENKGENGKYFSIENDIAINDTSDPKWYENENLKSWYSTEFDSSKAFSGTVFGNGHKISGLYFKNTENTKLCVGLIPLAGNTVIYDLTVDDAYLETAGQGDAWTGVGAFIGFNNWASITIFRCSAGKNVTIKSNAVEKLVAGGFIGTAPSGGGEYKEIKIYDSISAVKFNTDELSLCGGFIGDAWWSAEEEGKIKIQRSVSAVETVPLIQNYGAGSDFSNTYEIIQGKYYKGVTVLTSDQMKGNAAKVNMPGLLWDLWLIKANDYPKLKSCSKTADWDGTAAAEYAGGTGTESDPYRITNVNELALMVQNNGENGKYFSIENDIAINDASDPKWYKNENLKSWYSTEFDSSKAFSGTVFGNGHKISGLYFKNTENTKLCVGLIPLAGNTVIYDLTVDDAYLETAGQGDAWTGVGAFIGFNNWASITIFRCSAGKNVIVKSASEKLIAGGFVGAFPGANEAKIYDSISAVKFETENLEFCGGFIGDCSGGGEWGNIDIQRSVSAVEGVPLIRNYYRWYDFNNTYAICDTTPDACYKSVTTLTSDQMKGNAAKVNMPGLLWDLWLIKANDYPKLKSCSKTADWDGTAAAEYAGGTGTESDPYRITNTGELARMVENKGENGKYFSIESDIAINDTSGPKWFENENLKSWYSTEFDSSKAFSGTVFGNGHKISGLYFKNTENTKLCVGLIPLAGNTAIYDLTVDNAYLETAGQGDSWAGVGAFIGFDNWAAIHIYRCSVGKNVIIRSTAAETLKAGGLIGVVPNDSVETKIYDSISAVQFDTGDLSRCGGFIGDCWGGGNIKIERSVSAVENAPLIQNYWSWSDFWNTYEIIKGNGYNQVTALTLDQMMGESARINMPGLSWDHIWNTRGNDYPELKSCNETAGDINGDGCADILDLIKAEKHIAGVTELTGICFNSADLDKDGYVNSVDLILLRKILLGVDVKITDNYKITADYKIIYSEKDTKAKEYAQMLKEYYSDKHNLNLSVESDKSPAISKELLVGNTNRRTVNMKENEYSVRTSGLKVIFSGGHTAMLEKAVQTFIRLGYTDGKIHTFVNSTDFVANRFGYTYAWGDEFDSYTLDTNKWCREAKMSGFTDLDITTSPEYANTDNGYLKLFAKRYENYNNKNIVAAVPYSICTKNTMSFRYGYFEMRARLPFMQGAWPSLWAVSNEALGSEECSQKHKYLIEVDMLEVFSSTDTLMSNIHKWFTDGTERHTMWPQDDMRRGYTFAGGNLINEYHIYGCEWTPNEISMYVDGKKFFTFDITKDFDNEGVGMDGFRENQLFLIFNNHIFTENAVMNEDGSKTVDLNTLPIEYDIDWVRLYQKNDGLSNRYEKKGSNVIKYTGDQSEIYK